ncbi:MAG: hypothetical protein MI861_06655 [Pirellulales bacterium]|nr:hypothetical protein [Pirellulales bacterium]
MSLQLGKTINRVVENATVQIQAAQRERFLRSKIATAMVGVVVVPIAGVIFQLWRWGMGWPAGFGFSWPWWIVLTISFPLVWLLARTLLEPITVGRQQALGQMDVQLGASERLVTADQFLRQPNRDAFMQAAVDDASQWAEKARKERLDPEIAGARYLGRSLWAIPVAAALLAASAWLSKLAISPPLAATSTSDVASPPANLLTTGSESPPQSSPAENRSTPPEDPQFQPTSDRKPEQRSDRQGTATNAIPDQAQQSLGRLADGETSQSQRSSNPSSARGEPSSSGQPSTSDTQTPRKPNKKQRPKEDSKKPRQKQQDEDRPSGSTAGQGSSKGSDNNAAASDWSSKSQAATPDNEDIEEEDDVSDEEEEQESRGGVQPNMRDRRTPVNRDLQIGFGNNRPNPDANGRGGPGGQKKSRGVASLVLGVPIPDRITGQPNKGRIRITQQRITPEAEQSDPVVAENRGSREDAIGLLHHPEFSPWLQDFVRRYFLQRRSAHPLPPNVQSQSQTNLSTDSDVPPS